MGRRVCNSSACLPLHFGDDDDNVQQDIGQSAVDPTPAPKTTVPTKKQETATAPPTSQGLLGILGFTSSVSVTEALPPPIPSSEDERVKNINLKKNPQITSERLPAAAPTTAASKSFLSFGRLSISSSRAATEALSDDDEDFIRDNVNIKVNEQLKNDTETPKLSAEDKLVMDKVDAIINDEAYQGLDKQQKIRHLLQTMLSDESRTEIAKQAFYKMERLQENAYIATLVHDIDDDVAMNINKNEINDDAYNALKSGMVPTTIKVAGIPPPSSSSRPPQARPEGARGRKPRRNRSSHEPRSSSRHNNKQERSKSASKQRSKSNDINKKPNWMEPL